MIDLIRIGQVLREKREQSNLTIYDVGRIAGVTHGYVSALERGKGNPTISVLQGLATAVGADMEMRVVLPGEDPLAVLSAQERAVVEAMRSAELCPDDAWRLAGTAHALAVANGLARDMLVGQLDGIVAATRKSGGSAVPPGEREFRKAE